MLRHRFSWRCERNISIHVYLVECSKPTSFSQNLLHFLDDPLIVIHSNFCKFCRCCRYYWLAAAISFAILQFVFVSVLESCCTHEGKLVYSSKSRTGMHLEQILPIKSSPFLRKDSKSCCNCCVFCCCYIIVGYTFSTALFYNTIMYLLMYGGLSLYS